MVTLRVLIQQTEMFNPIQIEGFNRAHDLIAERGLQPQHLREELIALEHLEATLQGEVETTALAQGVAQTTHQAVLALVLRHR